MEITLYQNTKNFSPFADIKLVSVSSSENTSSLAIGKLDQVMGIGKEISPRLLILIVHWRITKNTVWKSI